MSRGPLTALRDSSSLGNRRMPLPMEERSRERMPHDGWGEPNEQTLALVGAIEAAGPEGVALAKIRRELGIPWGTMLSRLNRASLCALLWEDGEGESRRVGLLDVTP